MFCQGLIDLRYWSTTGHHITSSQDTTPDQNSTLSQNASSCPELDKLLSVSADREVEGQRLLTQLQGSITAKEFPRIVMDWQLSVGEILKQASKFDAVANTKQQWASASQWFVSVLEYSTIFT